MKDEENVIKYEDIHATLQRNVELSEEEYAKQFDKACKTADGNIGKAREYAKKPVSEKTKHARIQSNFYGTSINYIMAIYEELARLNDLMAMALGFVKPEEDKKDEKIK